MQIRFAGSEDHAPRAAEEKANAALIGVAATALGSLLVFAGREPLGADTAPPVLLLTTGAAAHFGGRVAGWCALATGLAAAAAFLGVDGGGGLLPHDLVQLVLMALVGGLLLVVAARLRESRRRLLGSQMDSDRLRREHERAEQDLAQVRTVVDGLDFGVVVLDKAGNVLEWNPAALRLFGFADAEDLRGPLEAVACRFEVSEPGGAVLPVEQWPVARALRGERVVDCELLVRVDGAAETKCVRFASTSVTETAGRREFVVVSMRDMTAERRAQAELQRTGALLRAVVEGTTDAVFVKDLEGRYVLINEAGARIFGMQVSEVLGRDDVPLFGPEEASRLRASDLAIMSGGGPQLVEETYAFQGENHTWLSMKGPLLGATGTVQGLIGISRDITDRKRAEAERAAMEDHLRLLLEHSPAAIAMFDRDMRYLACSRRWRTDCGLDESAWMGRTHYELFPDLSEDWRAVHRRCLDGAIESREDDPWQRADGTVQWFRWEVRPWHDVAGEIGGIVIFAEDVTARRTADAALRDSEDRYRRLVEVLPDSMFLQAEERIRFANPAFLRLVGAAAPEQVLGHSPFEFFAPEYHAIIRERITTLQREGRPTPRLEERVLRRDGKIVPVEVTAAPIVDHGVPSVLVVLHDLSEKQRTMGMLQSVLGSVDDAILMIDERGIIRSANAAVRRLFGHDPDRLVGRSIVVLMPAEHAARHGDHLREYLGTGSAKVIGLGREVEAMRADGSRFPAEISVTELVMDGARHFTCVLRDITARRQLEAQIEHAQRMEAIGCLAGGIAHDFNNLLTVINGHTELLLATARSGDPVREDLVAIRESGERAARLTRQLLTFSRQGVVAPRVLDLGELVDSSVKLLRRLIGEDVRVEVAVQASVPPVRIDPGQCEQLLMNLVVNARDAMPTGGVLRIGLAAQVVTAGNPADLAPGDYVKLTVGDTGCGMTEDVRRRVFEPFFTTKAPGHGTGLGLSVVHGIVSQNGGHIAVRSEPGVGSTFEVLLPATAGEVVGTETVMPPQLVGGRASVLLVEDEAAVRQIAGTVLESAGYTVLEADSGKAALALAKEHRGAIDLLLTDVVMPEFSGRELAERLRAIQPRLRLLYTSGYTDDAMVRYGVVTAEASFLAKPFTPLQLLHKVAAVMTAPT